MSVHMEAQQAESFREKFAIKRLFTKFIFLSTSLQFFLSKKKGNKISKETKVKPTAARAYYDHV